MKGIEKTLARKLIENVKNPFVRSFLQDNLSEFVKDVHTFSCDIFANLSAERKPFVKSAGLAFLSSPIVSLTPELPWHRIKVAIENAVRETLSAAARNDESSTEADAESGVDTSDLIERAITAAFISVCESSNGQTGAILVGGLADLLGKYIALYIAGSLDEAQSRLIGQNQCYHGVSIEPPDRLDRATSFYSPCHAQPYVEEC